MSEETPHVEAEVVPDAPPPPAKPKAEIIPIEAGRGVALRSFEDMQRWAGMMIEANMAPRNWTRAQVAAAIQTGLEVGLPGPMASLRSIYVVGGMPAFRGSAALGLIRWRRDLCAYIKPWVEYDEHGPVKGVCVSQRHGQEAERDEYTRAQAQAAGRWNKKTSSGEATPWVTDPDSMLMWRAVGRHVSKWWSDLLYGFPIAEAMDDYRGESSPSSPPAPGQPPPIARPATDPLLDSLTGSIGSAPPKPDAPIPGGAPQVVGLEGQLRESIERTKPVARDVNHKTGEVTDIPFPSHAAADAAIAAEDAKTEAKQKPLFEKPKKR